MKWTYLLGLLLCLVSLTCVGMCIFTDWNDSLFLILSLSLSAAVNLWNALRYRKMNSGEEKGK